MTDPRPPSQRFRFGDFEADLHTGELRKAGVRVKLSGQPFQVLAILLERPGDVITREELQKRLWPDTFVDVERNLNTAINKIRDALGDSAETPHFVETLPRRGYRFIAPVDGGKGSSEAAVAAPPPAEAKLWAKPVYFAPALLGAVALMIGAAAIWKAVSRTEAPPRVLAFTKLTHDGHAKVGPLTTDGSRIYFNERLPGARDLVVQVSVKGGEAALLSVPLKQPGVLDLSRDGSELLLSNAEREAGKDASEFLVANDLEREDISVWLQPVAGGSPRPLGTTSSIDAAFGADDKTILVSRDNAIYAESRDDASPRKLLTVEGTPFAMRFSPDGRLLRFSRWNSQTPDAMAIMETTADGTGQHAISEGCCGEWMPDGQSFIFQNRHEGRLDLWALPERSSPWRRKRDNKPIQLTSGPLDFQFPLPSKDGKVIFAIGTSRQVEVVRYDQHSGQFVPYLSGISAEGLAFSQDGQWVTYTSYPDGMLWRSKMDGSERLQLTFPPMRALLPRLSPDGKQIAFTGFVPGSPFNIYLISIEGGKPLQIHPSEQIQTDASWSPDSGSLLYGSLPRHDAPIFNYDLKTQQVSALPDSTKINSPHWSPDGKHIAALNMAHHAMMLFDVTTQTWTKALDFKVGWENWSRDGRFLYFVDYDNPAVFFHRRVLRLRLSDHKIENVVDLQNLGRRATGTFAAWVGLTPDDSPLFARDISSQEIYALAMEWPQ